MADMTQGVIVQCNPRRCFIFIQHEQGILFSHLEEDCLAPNGHTCMFAENVPVVFERAFRNGKDRAINVQLDCLYEVPEWEVSVISRWNGTYGFVQRPCGCHLFLSGTVLSGGLGKRDAYVGMKIKHRVYERSRGHFSCKDVEVLE